MSTNTLAFADSQHSFARPIDTVSDGTILRRRIAGLTRMLDARDRTICDLVRLREQSLRNAARTTPAQTDQSHAHVSHVSECGDVAGQLKAAMARLEKAEKMMSIGHLAGGIAHELNTPIQYVADNVMFLKRAFDVILRALDASRAGVTKCAAQDFACDLSIEETELEFFRADFPEAIEQSREGLRHIAAIVTAMKNFSRPSNDVVAPADLAQIIETTLSISRHEWKYIADVETHFAEDLESVPCIRDDIETAVLGLIVNAARAIRQAHRDRTEVRGKIVITTQRCGDYAEILIADTGAGIADAEKHRVFEPSFNRVGTAPCLSFARACIVEHHNGEIFFDSQGQGTTFHVRIPLRVMPGAT